MLLCLVALANFQGIAQFAPAAGELGSTAIHKDSSIFVGWAKTCIVDRGYIKITDTALTFDGHNKATHGNDTNALGKADGKVVSLGDKGTAVLTFETPVANGPGPDFAVFENAFRAQEDPWQYFLELAFVEVSSDGQKYVRFPSVSNTPGSTQLGTFGQVDPKLVHNFAGKYELFHGTPFDLEELKDSAGLDVNHITSIKLIDAVGTIDEDYASRDANRNMVNDPWPTPFPSGGFDLDAAGVIHEKGNVAGISPSVAQATCKLYPNPAHDYFFVETASMASIEIFNNTGLKTMSLKHYENHQPIPVSQLQDGLYLVRILADNEIIVLKLLID